MTTHPRHPESLSNAANPVPSRVPADRHIEAAARLLPAPPHQREQIARQFLAGARAAGYDLSNMWCTTDPADTKSRIREACLAIEGPGKTAMCFLSGPESGETDDGRDAERGLCLRSMVDHLDPARISLAQALPELHESWAVRAYEHARFTHAGDLSYMELELQSRRRKQPPHPSKPISWPAGIETRSVRDPYTNDRDNLLRVLESSYIDTLDCPELCGLRATDDVLESHLSTGAFDPSLWTLAFEGETPIGCSLVSPIPENGSAELVYIGLSPSGRGRGLGRALLEHSITQLQQHRIERLVCAVDRRNQPAVRLYESLGFQVFSARSAWVHPVRATSTHVGESV